MRSSVANCGILLAWGDGGSRTVRLMVYPDGNASYSGVMRCASPWECPNCAERLSFERGKECQDVLSAHLKSGGGAYLVTLTLPHDQGDHLDPLRRAVSNGWRKVCSGAPWKRAKDRYGIIGSVRALECTVGANGWHPHLHVILLTARWLSDGRTDELRRVVACRWNAQMQQAGFRPPHAEHGVTIQRGDKAGFYLAGVGLARELTLNTGKVARGGNRTPWQILESLTLQEMSGRPHDPLDLALWQEWCRWMRGVRQLTWSVGLRERYLDGPERSDEEIVNETPGEPVELLAIAENDWWRMATVPALLDNLLDKAEALAMTAEIGQRAREALRGMVESAIGRRLENQQRTLYSEITNAKKATTSRATA